MGGGGGVGVGGGEERGGGMNRGTGPVTKHNGTDRGHSHGKRPRTRYYVVLHHATSHRYTTAAGVGGHAVGADAFGLSGRIGRAAHRPSKIKHATNRGRSFRSRQDVFFS